MLVMAMDQARTAPRGAMRQRRYTSQSSSSPLQTTIRAQGSVKRTTVNRGVTSDSEEEMKLSSKKSRKEY